MFYKAIVAAAMCGSIVSGAQAQSISLAPGSTVAGYLPLALFGVAPVAGMTGDGHKALVIPTITFAGQAWTRIEVSENGFVTLGNAALPASLWTSANLSLPDTGIAAPILAPFWSDIDSTGGGIRIGSLTDGIGNWLVVDWADVRLADNSIASFQIWLGYNGFEEINYTYGDEDISAAAFTVGAQDASGTVGTNYRYNSGSIAADTGLVVTTRGLPLPPVPEPASWALMIGGFALAGAALRHPARRQICFA